jgi:hypothetical protein
MSKLKWKAVMPPNGTSYITCNGKGADASDVVMQISILEENYHAALVELAALRGDAGREELTEKEVRYCKRVGINPQYCTNYGLGYAIEGYD